MIFPFLLAFMQSGFLSLSLFFYSVAIPSELSLEIPESWYSASTWDIQGVIQCESLIGIFVSDITPITRIEHYLLTIPELSSYNFSQSG